MSALVHFVNAQFKPAARIESMSKSSSTTPSAQLPSDQSGLHRKRYHNDAGVDMQAAKRTRHYLESPPSVACSSSFEDNRKELASLEKDRESALHPLSQKYVNAEHNMQSSQFDARARLAKQMTDMEEGQDRSRKTQKKRQANEVKKLKATYAKTGRELELRIEKPKVANRLGKALSGPPGALHRRLGTLWRRVFRIQRGARGVEDEAGSLPEQVRRALSTRSTRQEFAGCFE